MGSREDTLAPFEIPVKTTLAIFTGILHDAPLLRDSREDCFAVVAILQEKFYGNFP
jgi:hypothetical protein